MASKTSYITLAPDIRLASEDWEPSPIRRDGEVQEGTQDVNKAGVPLWGADFLSKGKYGAQIVHVTVPSRTKPTATRIGLLDDSTDVLEA